MRILIAADLEGISGISVWDQTRDRTSLYYQEARHLLMGDVDAAIEGCLEGGATEVVAEDEHATGFNFIPERMNPKAVYLTGKARPRMSQRESVYKDFDGVILLGYHAMAGTKDGVLNHTQSSKGGNQYWYNERECGEMIQSALRFGHLGVPIIMVSGDEATCREAREFFGDAPVTVAVKKAITVQYAFLIPPKKARAMIRQGAREAVGRISQCKPFKMQLPIKGRLRFGSKEIADGFNPKRGARVDDRTFEATFESAMDIYEF